MSTISTNFNSKIRISYSWMLHHNLSISHNSDACSNREQFAADCDINVNSQSAFFPHLVLLCCLI